MWQIHSGSDSGHAGPHTAAHDALGLQKQGEAVWEVRAVWTVWGRVRLQHVCAGFTTAQNALSLHLSTKRG